jgi:uncharacterized protein (TIGR02594 family)
MTQFNTETIYTSVTDSWKSLQTLTRLDQKGLIDLNPHISDVAEIEAGIPIDVPLLSKKSLTSRAEAAAKSGKSPYQYAQEELLKNVSELPGQGTNHTRITAYHATTQGGAAPDEVAWCSSFVNYCVEKSGRTGTDSKAARSWKTWGTAVPKTEWSEGDIVVFWRVSPSSWEGHVGFLVDASGARPEILGGNQSNRLSIATPYPYSQILTVRRG